MQLDSSTNRYILGKITIRNYPRFDKNDLIYPSYISDERKKNAINKEIEKFGNNDKCWIIEQSIVDAYVDIIDYVKNTFMSVESKDSEEYYKFLDMLKDLRGNYFLCIEKFFNLNADLKDRTYDDIKQSIKEKYKVLNNHGNRYNLSDISALLKKLKRAYDSKLDYLFNTS